MRIYLMRHGETPWNRGRRLQGRSDIRLNEFGEELARVTGEGLSDVRFDLCISSPLTRTRQTALWVLSENKRFLEKRGLSDSGAEKVSGRETEHKFLDKFTLFSNFLKKIKENSDAIEKDAEHTQGKVQDVFSGFPLLTDERLIEINFGEWEGLGCGADNMEIPCDNFQDFFSHPERVKMPAGGETTNEVKLRTADFLREITSVPALSDKTILISAHGCSVRAMLNPFYEDREDFWQGHPPFNCAVNILETDAEGRLVLSERDRIYYDPELAANFYGK